MRKINNNKNPHVCQSQKHLGKFYPTITIKTICPRIFIKNRNKVILESMYT